MKDLKTLDLNLLKALDALLDEQNVTRAAARLGVTQPAMSAMLVRLRGTFGDPLFARARRGIVPTRRALALAEPLRQVMGQISALLQPAVFEPSSATLTFTIAATDYAARAIAAPFATALRQRAPHMRVSLVAVEEARVQSQLEHSEVDLALLTPETSPPDLYARRLFDERYVCVMRADHPAAQGRRLTLRKFCELDHALVSYSGNRFRGVTDAALETIGKARRVMLSVQNFLILPELLRASDMVAVLPARLVRGLDGLAVFNPPVAIPGFTKTAVWHERTHREPAHRWLRELLVETCGDTRLRSDYASDITSFDVTHKN
ncbi:LysR family transcriptional regulator [Cupriavidus taiwanensis]|uniref:LysR family transcriptional regulator n=1 Tax=Cupriavidus taiwanensis TaxID=164546 RepID=UPI000E14D91E|nr:LysR family transcriptional regulator [Cupriavidus taiwanensis]SPA53743.1 Transcriptional regulator [Cupriavidus taiwanensis]